MSTKTLPPTSRESTTTVYSPEPEKGGKGGKGGISQVSNEDFITAIFHQLPEGASPLVCSKSGNPDDQRGWPAKPARGKLSPRNNNYVSCASFHPATDGSYKARKANATACHFIMLDDLGGKTSMDKLRGFELSWLIETSPNNYQGGIILADPINDYAEAEGLLTAAIDAVGSDKGATGPMSRWSRLPNAINGKPKHFNADGTPFQCQLVEWRPERRYTLQEIVDGLQLNLERTKSSARIDEDVLVPRAKENPIVAALKLRGLYKSPLGSGKHDITCPWVHEHTDGLDSGTAYFEPEEIYPLGGFSCLHSHTFHINDLLEFLEVTQSAARHKPVIRVVSGDLHRVVDAAEKELAVRGRHYQSGSLIVSVSTDPTSGDPSIVPTSAPALTRELSVAATWEKYDGRAKGWLRCDPPSRHTAILYDAQQFNYLAPLAGVARQPYFRESDGKLVTEAGYDNESQRFGVFDARQFVVPDPTLEAARSALTLLEDLLSEFRFVSPNDKSAALSAIFTAVVRPTLPHAPAFHIKAPVFGSGKTYLCELIGAFAGPAKNAKVSYPTTSEEATKVILSLLLTSPAVIEFDDMDTDWTPHGTVKRMLTAEQITDRILGVSKTATVSTRTLFLGSGNNVGPVRDLLRRVLTIHIDPSCSTPATLSYTGLPVEKVHKHRGAYVSAVLTIIQAWRKAGLPRAPVDNVVTYGGAWADYCRHPLIWLGHADPATALLHQIRHDPDGDALGGLMTEWRAAFGNAPTTIRKALTVAPQELIDAFKEFPVEERGEINKSKLGWIFKRNANRVVDGYEIQADMAGGRKAWRVIGVDTPPSPPLPPLPPAVEKTVSSLFASLPTKNLSLTDPNHQLEKS